MGVSPQPAGRGQASAWCIWSRAKGVWPPHLTALAYDVCRPGSSHYFGSAMIGHSWRLERATPALYVTCYGQTPCSRGLKTYCPKWNSTG